MPDRWEDWLNGADGDPFRVGCSPRRQRTERDRDGDDEESLDVALLPDGVRIADETLAGENHDRG